jgi:hypothetical protein
MIRVNRKDFYPVKRNSVLILTSGYDNFITSSFALKYFIADIKMIGTSLSSSGLFKQNYKLIEVFK